MHYCLSELHSNSGMQLQPLVSSSTSSFYTFDLVEQSKDTCSGRTQNGVIAISSYPSPH